jgi:hypothetical protein
LLTFSVRLIGYEESPMTFSMPMAIYALAGYDVF